VIPRILDRYVARQVFAPFTLALAVFTFLLLMPPLSLMAEQLLAKGVPWLTVGFLMVTLLPQALAITIPIGFLLGLLVAFGRLSADSEWVALQACGVSLVRLLRPVGLIAVAAWAATSWVIIWAVPWGNMTWKEITFNILATWAETDVKPRVFFEGFPRLVLYVREAPAGVPGWQDVFVAQTADGSQPVIHLARQGRMVVNRAERTVDMVLENGSTHQFATDEAGRQQYRISEFASNVIRLDPSVVFPGAGATKLDNEMTIAELRAWAAQLRAKGESDHNPVWTIHNKFAIPIACLVFALLGMSIGFSTARSGRLGSFVLGVGIVFVHWMVMYLGRNLAKGGAVPAWFASWLPDLVLGAVGVFLFARRMTAAEGPLQVTLPFRRRADAAPGPANGLQASPAPQRRAGERRAVVVVRVPHLGLPRPRILDAYVSKLFARIFTLGFVSFLGIFYIATFIDLSEKLFKGHATIGMLGAFLWFKTPQFVYYVIPLATLIAALVVIGVLARSSELVVMKACGISLYRLAVPLMVSGAIASGGLFLIEEWLLGPANRQAEVLEAKIRDRPSRFIDVLNRRWIVARNGAIYNYVYFDARAGELNGLTIFEFDRSRWHLARRTFAAQARVNPAGEPADAEHGRSWRGVDGWVRDFGGPGREPEWRPFRQQALALEPPDYFGSEQPDAERMSYTQLRGYVKELERSGFDVVRLTVDLQRKLSFPFITVVMTLIAIPFAVSTGRRGMLYGVGAGIALAMTYWITGNVFGAIGSAGLIAPLLAAWAPNLLFGTAAAYLLFTVRT